MEGRELTFADATIRKLVRQNFVAVAGDDWYQRRRQDTEGEFFRRVTDQGPRKGEGGATRQGIYVLTASGTLLGYRNHQDPAVMYAFLRECYFSWRRLPLEERQPGRVRIEDPERIDPRFQRDPPTGGLVLNVFTRILSRDQSGDFCPGICAFRGGQRSARDHFWLTAEECKMLLPRDAKRGDIFPVPGRVALRLARFHLVDNTRGEPQFWEKQQVRSAKLNLIVGASDERGLKMRLEGSFLLATSADPARAKRGFDLSLLGYLTYDSAKKAFTRFDVLAVGQHWGDGPFTAGARPGRSPLGVVLELASSQKPADRVPPEAARNWRQYLAAEE